MIHPATNAMDDRGPRRLPWWEYAIASLVGFSAAGYGFWYLGEMEKHPGTYRVPSVIALLYPLGGRWLCILPFLAIGCLFALLSVRSWKRRNEPPSGNDRSAGVDPPQTDRNLPPV
jgi:hypothetical protein